MRRPSWHHDRGDGPSRDNRLSATKSKQCEVSGALYLIAIELDARGLIESATRRGEQVVAAMLSTANDGHFPNPHVIAQTLFGGGFWDGAGILRARFAAVIGGNVERQLTIMCVSHLSRAAEMEKAMSRKRL